MLNYLMSIKHCPICHNVLDYNSQFNKTYLICDNGPICHNRHFMKIHLVYENIIIEEEQFDLGEHFLSFNKDALKIYFNKDVIYIKNCNILYTDLNSYDKIKKFIRNYQILC